MTPFSISSCFGLNIFSCQMMNRFTLDSWDVCELKLKDIILVKFLWLKPFAAAIPGNSTTQHTTRYDTQTLLPTPTKLSLRFSGLRAARKFPFCEIVSFHEEITDLQNDVPQHSEEPASMVCVVLPARSQQLAVVRVVCHVALLTGMAASWKRQPVGCLLCWCLKRSSPILARR